MRGLTGLRGIREHQVLLEDYSRISPTSVGKMDSRAISVQYFYKLVSKTRFRYFFTFPSIFLPGQFNLLDISQTRGHRGAIPSTQSGTVLLFYCSNTRLELIWRVGHNTTVLPLVNLHWAILCYTPSPFKVGTMATIESNNSQRLAMTTSKGMKRPYFTVNRTIRTPKILEAIPGIRFHPQYSLRDTGCRGLLIFTRHPP